MARQRKEMETAPSPQAPASATLVVRTKALVFISHDARDSDLAEAFGVLLTDASGGVLKSFRSSDRKGTDGIEYGVEWYPAIMTALDEATDVVALLTDRSINRPWILYEAGVAKGKLDSTVFGIALGVPLDAARTGPFAQFQNCADDEDSLTKLVLQLIRRNPDAAPREEAVRRQVQAFRETVGALLKAGGRATTPAGPSKLEEVINVAKLFEEVKVMFGTLPERIEEKLRTLAPRRSALRRRGLHPMMLEELLFHPAMRDTPEGPATGWLMFLGILRDEMPWLHDVGMDFYHALRSGNPERIGASRRSLLATLEAAMHSRAMRHMLIDNEESYMMLRHLPEMIEHYLDRLSIPGLAAPKKRAGGKSSKETE